MRQWVKKSVRYLFVLVVLTVTILLLQAVIIPRMLQKLILSRLADIGLSQASLEVSNCSFGRTELSNVELGRERCACIGTLTAEYSLGSLFSGKVKKIQITGGQLTIRVRDGKIELGELAQITLKDSQQGKDAPFDRIELRACTLYIDWPHKKICIPCEGSINNNGAGWIMHDLGLNLQGTPLQLKAALYTRGESLAFSIGRQDIDLRALITVLPVESFSIPARLDGKMSLKLQGDISRNNASALLRASVTNGWVKTKLADLPLDAQGIGCEVEVELENLYQLKNIEAKLTVEQMEYADIPTSDVQIEVEKAADKLNFSAEAQGEGWRLKNFSATLPAAPGAKNSRMQMADVSWELEGNIPEPIVKKLADKDFDTSSLGEININGSLSTNLSRIPDVNLINLQLALEPGTLNIGRGRLLLKDLSGILKFRGNYSEEEAQVRLLSDSEINFDGVDFEGIKLGTTSLELKGFINQNTPNLTFSKEGLITNIELEVNTNSADIRTPEDIIMARLDGIGMLFDASFSPKLNRAGGSLTANSVDFYPGFAGLCLNLQNANMNVDSKLDDDKENTIKTTLTLDRAALSNEKAEQLFAAEKEAIMPFQGLFNLENRNGEFQSSCSIQKGTILNFSGNLNLTEKNPSVSLKAVCKGLHLDEEQAVVKMLTDSTGLVTEGDLSFKADLNWRQGRFTPRVEIDLADTSLSSSRYKVKAKGVNGSVVLNSLFPISTPGNQMLTVKSLNLGKLEFTDGLIAFRLEKEPAAAFIERTEWGLMGGHIYSHALRIDDKLPRVNFKLFAENIDLNEMLFTAFGEKAAGQGKLYGMIPVSISTSSLNDVRLGRGFFYSSSQEGWWKFAEDTSQSAAWQILEKQFGSKFEEINRSKNKESLLKGLLDFEYSRLKLDFVDVQGSLTARITTQGKSRNEKIPVEFEEIVFEIPRFEENLRKLIAIKSEIDLNLKERTEKVE